MKKFFDTLLEKRNYKECPLPLWRLKITDTEFSELYCLRIHGSLMIWLYVHDIRITK